VSYNGQTNGLLPPRFSLPVVHQQVAVAQPPGGAEIQHPPVDRSLKSNRCIAERAEGDSDRYSSDRIIDDLVPDENLDGVGAYIVAHLEEDHWFVRLEPSVCCADVDELG